MERFAGLITIGLIALFASTACNRPADYALVGSAYVPAVHGDIRIEKIDKQQVLIVVTLDQLPPPDRIEPELEHYLVWFTPVGGYPSLQGALDYDAAEAAGRASIPTDMREFEVQITAENDESPAQPSDLVVASQRIREE